MKVFEIEIMAHDFRSCGNHEGFIHIQADTADKALGIVDGFTADEVIARGTFPGFDKGGEMEVEVADVAHELPERNIREHLIANKAEG